MKSPKRNLPLPEIAALRARRRTARITQHELARASGLSMGYLSQLESGRKQTVSRGAMDRLEQTLNLLVSRKAHN
jgi:transcriptional regulator with XRE-family HTH domain